MSNIYVLNKLRFSLRPLEIQLKNKICVLVFIMFNPSEDAFQGVSFKTQKKITETMADPHNNFKLLLRTFYSLLYTTQDS